MTHRYPSTAAIALAAALSASPLAAEVAAPQAIGGAKAVFARIVLAFGALSGDVIRSKGVLKLNHVGTGIYCIKAEKSVKKAVPTVSTERLQSPTSAGLLAYWRWDAFHCPNKRRWIEVNTYDFSAGFDPALSDDVSFTLVVP